MLILLATFSSLAYFINKNSSLKQYKKISLENYNISQNFLSDEGVCLEEFSKAFLNAQPEIEEKRARLSDRDKRIILKEFLQANNEQDIFNALLFLFDFEYANSDVYQKIINIINNNELSYETKSLAINVLCSYKTEDDTMINNIFQFLESIYDKNDYYGDDQYNLKIEIPHATVRLNLSKSIEFNEKYLQKYRNGEIKIEPKFGEYLERLLNFYIKWAKIKVGQIGDQESSPAEPQ